MLKEIVVVALLGLWALSFAASSAFWLWLLWKCWRGER